MLSIAVDPALIFNLFRVFAALACIAISGFLLVYFAFGIRHPLTAIATALPIGLASTLLVSNLLAYILGTPRALTWGLLAVFVITSLIAVARRHLFKPVQPVSWLDGALFAAAGILLLILSVANYAVLHNFELLHTLLARKYDSFWELSRNVARRANAACRVSLWRRLSGRFARPHRTS